MTIYTLRSGVVRVEDAEESLYAAIDIVCDKVSMDGAIHHRMCKGSELRNIHMDFYLRTRKLICLLSHR